MVDGANKEQAYWDRHAKLDPLWAILSDPSKTGRRWDLRSFLETGRREVSLLMYQLRALGVDIRRDAALDFGCGVGRLSQPLATYFDRVVGVDVSPEMIRLAHEINQYPSRVRYVCNTREDLAVLSTGEFTFMYSNVVLQHIEPANALRYLSELLRVVAPSGVLVFQLPSHLRPPEEQRSPSKPMAEQAYRASVHAEWDAPQAGAPGAEVVLVASVTNTSAHAWSQPQVGPIRLGNHWLAGSGDPMLIQDDGRTPLPENVAPGQTCRVTLKVTLPPESGEYQLECDLVHEGISWFADKGSGTWRCKVRVAGSSDTHPADESSEPTLSERALSLPDVSSVESPGPLPMHGIHHDVVKRLIKEYGATLLHLERDERCGDEWVGYRYFVRKSA
jgi:2-polyprenyl-3-methyl-5-hydroxy-6-metoxy-1,4-benzoquinol methylase